MADCHVRHDDHAGPYEGIILDANRHPVVDLAASALPVPTTVREVSQDRYADADCDRLADLDARGIRRLDQRVETDPGSTADLHASATVQHRPDGVPARAAQRSQL